MVPATFFLSFLKKTSSTTISNRADIVVGSLVAGAERGTPARRCRRHRALVLGGRRPVHHRRRHPRRGDHRAARRCSGTSRSSGRSTRTPRRSASSTTTRCRRSTSRTRTPRSTCAARGSTPSGTRSTNHDWLYFAWERDYNSGSGFIAYEFMQNPAPAGCAYDTATEAQLIANCNPWANRTAGDFMILWDQQGNSLDLYLRTWSGTAPNLTLGAPTLLNAAVSQAAYSADGFRGEAAVDLTATIFGGSTACRTFANTIPSTVTGNSDTADYKDTILKTAPPITNCTSTTVTTPKDAAPAADIPAGGALDRHRRRRRQGLGGGRPHRWHGHAGRLGRVLPVQGRRARRSAPPVARRVGSTNLTGAAYPVTVRLADRLRDLRRPLLLARHLQR